MLISNKKASLSFKRFYYLKRSNKKRYGIIRALVREQWNLNNFLAVFINAKILDIFNFKKWKKEYSFGVFDN